MVLNKNWSSQGKTSSFPIMNAAVLQQAPYLCCSKGTGVTTLWTPLAIAHNCNSSEPQAHCIKTG